MGIVAEIILKTAGLVLSAAALLVPPCSTAAAGMEPLHLSPLPAGGGRGQRFESEHRPLPVRSYRLDVRDLSPDAEAYVLHPDGSVEAVALRRGGGGVSLSFKTPFGDGPMHGVHNVYVLDRRVEGEVLTVRVAKWLTIHHHCSWGHGYRYDDERISPRSLATVPLEIVPEGLWDGNFHSRVMSGDRLVFKVLYRGRPVQGAMVRLRTAKGWTKEVVTDSRGAARFQLIRDYYPGRWTEFKSRHRGRFIVTAEYEVEDKGRYSGKVYERIRLISTLPWRYYPSRREYTSYASGLFVGVLFLTVSGAAVYAYRERRKRPYREVVLNGKD